MVEGKKDESNPESKTKGKKNKLYQEPKVTFYGSLQKITANSPGDFLDGGPPGSDRSL